MIVGGENSVLAVAEQRFPYGEVARFQPNPGAVRIGHPNVLKDEALDGGPAPAKHQRRLSLTGDSVEHRSPGLPRYKRNPSRLLHGTIPVNAGPDQDRPFAIADGVYGILEVVKRRPGASELERRGRFRRSECGED